MYLGLLKISTMPLIGQFSDVFRFRGGTFISSLKCRANCKAGKRNAVVFRCLE